MVAMVTTQDLPLAKYFPFTNAASQWLYVNLS